MCKNVLHISFEDEDDSMAESNSDFSYTFSLPSSQKRSQFFSLSFVITTTAFCLSGLDFPVYHRSVMIQESGSKWYQEEEFSSEENKNKTEEYYFYANSHHNHTPQNSANLQPSLLFTFS